MKTIYRYPVYAEMFSTSEDARCKLPFPEGARILHMAVQERAPHHPSLWVEVTVGAKQVERTFEIVGTGHEVPKDGTYVGTWQEFGFVWHLYEIQEASNGS